MRRGLTSLGWAFRVSLLVAAAIFFALASTTSALAQTDAQTCSDFDSQEQAQAALDDDPGLAQNLDPDDTGVACEDFDFSDDDQGSEDDANASNGNATANGAAAVNLTCEQLIELVEDEAAAGQYITEISQRCEGSANVVVGTVPGGTLANTGGPLFGLLAVGLLLTGGGLLLRSSLRRG